MKFIFRSIAILFLLYGIVFAIGDAVLSHYRAPIWFAIAFAVGFIALQYLIGPWCIEWMMDVVWNDDIHIPEIHRTFVRDFCAKRGMKAPRLGMIYSATPNAFSFGHTPGDARVVITKGLLDVLTPDEVNAVLAHELGHVENWDFAVMAVAALAPLMLYQIYVFGRNNRNASTVAWSAYLGYLISQFVVLLLNRTREYMADHYAAVHTGRPSTLASALVKIACGLVRSEGEYQQQIFTKSPEAKAARKALRLGGSLAILGISNLRSGQSLALGGADPSSAAKALRWDLVNPWARVSELNSTHPLTALRVQALNIDAAAMNLSVEYPLSEEQRAWSGQFVVELLLWASPAVIAFLLFFGIRTGQNVGGMLATAAAIWIVRTRYRYRGGYEPATIGALTQDVEASDMRPRAVRLQGEIVGRGVPGLFWSPDLVLRDETGLLFVLYRQSIPFARLLFAVRSADALIGQRVTIEGWFRRSLRPYVEMATLTTEDGKTRRAWSRWVQYSLAVAVLLFGILLL